MPPSLIYKVGGLHKQLQKIHKRKKSIKSKDRSSTNMFIEAGVAKE